MAFAGACAPGAFMVTVFGGGGAGGGGVAGGGGGSGMNFKSAGPF